MFDSIILYQAIMLKKLETLNIMGNQIISKLNGMVMDIQGGCKPSGTQIILYPKANYINQNWFFIAAPTGIPPSEFFIKSDCSNNLALDVKDSVLEQGTPVIATTLNENNSQIWRFERVPEPNPENWCKLLSHLNDDWCAEVQGSNPAASTKVVLGVADDSNPDNQLWRVDY
jgi:hypothetical protein